MPLVIPTPRAGTCEDCGSTSSLRMCAECGFVGCCESQLGHDREHALGSDHPVIVSIPVGRSSFTWCYECGRYV
ncbi:MAG: UBP-type zinc finger domain-containing protein [Actinomycetota bacterium]|nr:UBP-type zinc finger domain-containing protein [Actinomycetota bacterium]